MPRVIEIYGLTEPLTGEVRYIGKAVDSQKRLAGHLREARRQTPLYCWIKKLRRNGAVPGIRVLYRCLEEDWRRMEVLAIERARRDGLRLLNIAPGGDQLFCPPQTRSKNGAALARHIHDDPLRKRVWRLKKDVGEAYRAGELSKENIEAFRQCAKLAPELFGNWALLK